MPVKQTEQPIQFLTYTRERELVWADRSAPTLSDRTSALVRPFVVARSDLDTTHLSKDEANVHALGNFRQNAMTRLARRIHLDRYTAACGVGQQCIAEVIETGPDVTTLTPGQRVVVTSTLPCGSCLRCLNGMTAHCEARGEDERFGTLDKPSPIGGLLADKVRIPDAAKTLIALPDNLDAIELSSAGADLGDAWCALMPQLRSRKNWRVLVLGGGARSTSLYVIALAVSKSRPTTTTGCVTQLDYVDQSAERVALAAKLGANAMDKPLRRHSGTYDMIVSGNTQSGTASLMLQRLAPGGVYIQLQAQELKAEKLPINILYEKNLSLVTGQANLLTQLRAMLDYISTRDLDLAPINTHLAPFTEAHRDFRKNTTKVVVHRAPLFQVRH